MCDTSSFSSHLICQLPLRNLQDLGKSYFPFPSACFLNFLSTCSPKPGWKLVCRPLCSSVLHSSPILLRTYCCSVDLDGDLTSLILFCFLCSILFLRQTFRTHLSESVVIISPTHFCPCHFLQNSVQTPPNSTHSSASFFCPSFDRLLTSPTDLGFLSSHSSSTTFLTYFLCFSFNLSFLILFSLSNYYPTWKTFWYSACLAFLSLPVISVFLASYN